MRHYVRFTLPIAVVSSLVLCAAAVAEGPQPSGPPRTEEPQAGSYVPDLGDLMETAQLRHLKLSYAGSAKNWELANYELAQIRRSL